MTHSSSPVPEFSRPVAVTDLKGRQVFDLVADADERARLAARFDLDSLDRFEAHVVLRPVAGNVTVDLHASFEADVVQTCVVTLEPVPSTITGEFDAVFSSSVDTEEDADSVDVDPEAPDPPEPIEGGIIDLGEVVAERMGLEIDPFPRLPGAKFEGFVTGEGAAEGTGKGPNPFAALAKLKLGKN